MVIDSDYDVIDIKLEDCFIRPRKDVIKLIEAGVKRRGLAWSVPLIFVGLPSAAVLGGLVGHVKGIRSTTTMYVGEGAQGAKFASISEMLEKAGGQIARTAPTVFDCAKTFFKRYGSTLGKAASFLYLGSEFYQYMIAPIVPYQWRGYGIYDGWALVGSIPIDIARCFGMNPNAFGFDIDVGATTLISGVVPTYGNARRFVGYLNISKDFDTFMRAINTISLVSHADESLLQFLTSAAGELTLTMNARFRDLNTSSQIRRAKNDPQLRAILHTYGNAGLTLPRDCSKLGLFNWINARALYHSVLCDSMYDFYQKHGILEADADEHALDVYVLDNLEYLRDLNADIALAIANRKMLSDVKFDPDKVGSLKFERKSIKLGKVKPRGNQQFVFDHDQVREIVKEKLKAPNERTDFYRTKKGFKLKMHNFEQYYQVGLDAIIQNEDEFAKLVNSAPLPAFVKWAMSLEGDSTTALRWVANQIGDMLGVSVE